MQIAVRAAEALGVPSTPTDMRIALAFDGAALPPSFEKAHEIRSRAAAHLLESLRANELLSQASKNVEDPTDLRVSPPWTPMIRDPRGRPLVAAAEGAGELLLRTAASGRIDLHARADSRAAPFRGHRPCAGPGGQSDTRRAARLASSRTRTCNAPVLAESRSNRRAMVLDDGACAPPGRNLDSRTCARHDVARMPVSEPRDGTASGAHHELQELLGKIAVRLRARDGGHATSAALTCAAAVIVVCRLSGFTPLVTWPVLVAAAFCATAVITRNGPRRTTRAAAAFVERSNPHLRNLIITAEELLSRRGRTATYMRDRVLAEASRESDAGRSARRRAVGRPTRRRPARAPLSAERF